MNHKILNAMTASQRVKVGPRYVFFQSLASYTSWFYPKLYQIAKNYVSMAYAALVPEAPVSTQSDTDRIRAYIDYVGELAKNEASNEMAFINKFKNIIDNLDDNVDFKQQMLQYIDEMQYGADLDYTKFIAVINTIFNQNKTFSLQRQKIGRDNMRFIENVFQTADQDIQQKIIEALQNGDYNLYQKEISELFPDSQEDLPIHFSSPVSNILGNKFTSILKRVSSDRELINQLAQAWLQNGKNQNFIDYIAAAIFKYLNDMDFDELKEKTIKEIMDSISKSQGQDLIKYADDFSERYAKNIVNLLQKRGGVEKTLEEIALTTRVGLGDRFLELSQHEQQDVINLYSSYGFNFNLDTINDLVKPSDFKKISAQITKKLGEAIRKFAHEQFNITEIKNRRSKEQTARIQQELENNADFQKFNNTIKRKLNPQLISNQIKNFTLTGPASAEAMVMENAAEIQKHVEIFIGGGLIKGKSDVIITFDFEPDIPLDQIIDDQSVQDSIRQGVTKFGENFLTQMHKNIGDKVDVIGKEIAYRQTLENMRNEIVSKLEQLYGGEELTDKVNQILEQLNSLITAGVQVKDYVYGSSSGFMGESLGANLESILTNIDRMYELGGISHIDKELLYFVAANCGEDAVAHELKDDLATYLLGGAMMILFDDGFTAASAFLDKIKLDYGFTPQAIHLFNLQGGHYIPASFVYNTIYNNLLQVYSDLVTEEQKSHHIDTGTAQNQVTIQNNITESGDKPDWRSPGFSDAQSRWDAVAAKASDKNKIDIKLTFLAGILDMFEALPNAFKI